MPWTTPGTATAGDVLTAAFWNTQVRDNMVELAPFSAAWVSYTPTLTNTTAPITYAKYCKVGRFVAFTVLLTLTGAQVTGRVGITLPFAAASSLSGTFQAIFEDSGVAFFDAVAVLEGNTSRVDVYGVNTSGTYGFIANTSATVPFTWANNDKILLTGIYEAAS